MTGKITKQELSSELTAEIASGGGASTELATHLADEAAHGIGNKATLLTTNKTSIVSAMNELFTNANNLKSDWAGVVGNPLLATDTSAQLKSKMQTIKNKLAANLTEKGISSSGNAGLDVLATRVGQIETGKKWVSGTTITSSNPYDFILSGPGSPASDFIPSFFVLSYETEYLPGSMRTIYITGIIMPGVTLALGYMMNGGGNPYRMAIDTYSVGRYYLRIGTLPFGTEVTYTLTE